MNVYNQIVQHTWSRILWRKKNGMNELKIEKHAPIRQSCRNAFFLPYISI